MYKVLQLLRNNFQKMCFINTLKKKKIHFFLKINKIEKMLIQFKNVPKEIRLKLKILKMQKIAKSK